MISESQQEMDPKASVSSSHPINHLSQIFSKLATDVQAGLRKGLPLSPRSRRRLVQTVRDYLINDLKDTTLGTTNTISEQIVTTYNNTFTTRIASSESTKGEIESLRQSIYFSAHNIKNQSGNGNKLVNYLDDDDTLVEKPKVQDEYGCVAYRPVQPSSEVLASLEEARVNLKDNFTSPEEDITDEIIDAMDACYYLQRKDIQ